MSTLRNELEQAHIELVTKFNNQHYQWLMNYDQYFTHALTLTFNQNRIRRVSDSISHSKMMGKLEMLELQKKSFRCFRFKLNKLLFGNKVTRYGAGLLMVPVIEGLNGGSKVHYHCAVAVPQDRMEVFSEKVKEAWSYAPLTGHQIDIQPYRNHGWLGYMSKQAKYLNRECIDWDNVFVPKCFTSTAE